jgi:hypothetical protein
MSLNHTSPHARARVNAIQPMDLLAESRRYLASAIKQLEAINAGAVHTIAQPVTTEEAINTVT